MKRLISYLYLIVTLFGLSVSTVCRAADEDPFALFPESCAVQARAQYEEDLKNPDHYQFQEYDDARSSVVQAIRELERKLWIATFDIRTLPSVGSEIEYADRIPRRQSKAADHIFDDLPPEDFLNTSVYSHYRGDVPDSEIHYTCWTDSCPLGAECSFVDLRAAGDQLRQDLPMNRRIMERVLAWAKPIGRFRVKAIRLERAYDQSEPDIRRSIDELPPQLVIMTVRVPVEIPRRPPPVVVLGGSDLNPEVTTSDSTH